MGKIVLVLHYSTSCCDWSVEALKEGKTAWVAITLSEENK